MKQFKRIFLAALSLSMTANAFSATKYSTNPDECVDGVCFVPQYADDGRENYAIVSPVGYHDVPMITQAKRLDTLSGKTIALVGGSFMAPTTHTELKKCIEKEFPSSKIYMFDDIGQAGPYSVFGQTEKTKAFQDKLKELKVDAVIAGNCGCGLFVYINKLITNHRYCPRHKVSSRWWLMQFIVTVSPAHSILKVKQNNQWIISCCILTGYIQQWFNPSMSSWHYLTSFLIVFYFLC